MTQVPTATPTNEKKTVCRVKRPQFNSNRSHQLHIPRHHHCGPANRRPKRAQWRYRQRRGAPPETRDARPRTQRKPPAPTTRNLREAAPPPRGRPEDTTPSRAAPRLRPLCEHVSVVCACQAGGDGADGQTEADRGADSCGQSRQREGTEGRAAQQTCCTGDAASGRWPGTSPDSSWNAAVRRRQSADELPVRAPPCTSVCPAAPPGTKRGPGDARNGQRHRSTTADPRASVRPLQTQRQRCAASLTQQM